MEKDNLEKFFEEVFRLSHLQEEKSRALVVFIKNHILNKPEVKKDVLGNAGISPLKRRIDAAWASEDTHLKSVENVDCKKDVFIQELRGNDRDTIGGIIGELVKPNDRSTVLNLCRIYLNAYDNDGNLSVQSENLNTVI